MSSTTQAFPKNLYRKAETTKVKVKTVSTVTEPFSGPTVAQFKADVMKASERVSPRMEGATASEAVLKRVWDRPEEDEACRDL